VTARFLALGDSYTIGEGCEPEARWPTLLAGALADRGFPVAGPTIVATTGWTTDELMSGIDQRSISGRWDLVSLLAGVNDQYRGYGVERYGRSFSALLDQALGFAKLPGRLIVLSIPDWGVTPFAAGQDRAAISREIDRFNAVARSLAEAGGSQFVDITPMSRLAATDGTLLVSDGLHPSGAMYRMWVERVLPVAVAALQ
jgi:lysophospholipase L1-like esterase